MAGFPASGHPWLVGSKPCGQFALAEVCKERCSKGKQFWSIQQLLLYYLVMEKLNEQEFIHCHECHTLKTFLKPKIFCDVNKDTCIMQHDVAWIHSRLDTKLSLHEYKHCECTVVYNKGALYAIDLKVCFEIYSEFELYSLRQIMIKAIMRTRAKMRKWDLVGFRSNQFVFSANSLSRSCF